MITWNTNVDAPCCPGEIVDDDTGRTVLIQTDWDFPGVASTFGWSTEFVQRCPECGVVHLDPDEIYTKGFPVEWRCPKCHQNRTTPCPHETTDGSVDCDCGMAASAFIAAAREWLDNHDGATVENPGYFQEV